MQTEQLLCWSGTGMTDTEHSTTSSSNEEEKKMHDDIKIYNI